ncbi:uncharacterized protein DFL_004706 [Arthrobotrys flagrans]|uniref:Uncharacterized protein n=1 Tax=Arthrobotrys flagrans TaxID=97331 RepID=A0A437A5Z2_ARTFL|nr:hypothetical protein DFL_004706 [Arthrobotrys flagrans]
MPARDLAGDLAKEIFKLVPGKLAKSQNVEFLAEEYLSKEPSPGLDPEIPRDVRLERIFERYLKDLELYLPRYLDEILDEEVQNIATTPQEQKEEEKGDVDVDSEPGPQIIHHAVNDPEDFSSPDNSSSDPSDSTSVPTTPKNLALSGTVTSPADIYNGGYSLQPSNESQSQNDQTTLGLTGKAPEGTFIPTSPDTISKSSSSGFNGSDSVLSSQPSSELTPTTSSSDSLDSSSNALPRAVEESPNQSVESGSIDQSLQAQTARPIEPPQTNISPLKAGSGSQSPNGFTQPVSNTSSTHSAPSPSNTESYSEGTKSDNKGHLVQNDLNQHKSENNHIKQDTTLPAPLQEIESPISQSENRTTNTPSTPPYPQDINASESISENDGRSQSKISNSESAPIQGASAQVARGIKTDTPAKVEATPQVHDIFNPMEHPHIPASSEGQPFRSTELPTDREAKYTPPTPEEDPFRPSTTESSSTLDPSVLTIPLGDVAHQIPDHIENSETPNKETSVGSEIKENQQEVVQDASRPAKERSARNSPSVGLRTGGNAQLLGDTTPSAHKYSDNPAGLCGNSISSTRDLEAKGDSVIDVPRIETNMSNSATDPDPIQQTQIPISQIPAQLLPAPNNAESKAISPIQAPVSSIEIEGDPSAGSLLDGGHPDILDPEHKESTETAVETLKDAPSIDKPTTSQPSTTEPHFSEASSSDDISMTGDSEVALVNENNHQRELASVDEEAPLFGESKSDAVVDKISGPKNNPPINPKSPALENDEFPITSGNTDQLSQKEPPEAIFATELPTPEMVFDKRGSGSPLSESSAEPEDDDDINFSPGPKTHFSGTQTPIPVGKATAGLGLLTQVPTEFEAQQVLSPPVYIVEPDQDRTIEFPDPMQLLTSPYYKNAQLSLPQFQDNAPIKMYSTKLLGNPQLPSTRDIIAKGTVQQNQDDKTPVTTTYEPLDTEEQDNVGSQMQAEILANSENSTRENKRSRPKINEHDPVSEPEVEEQKTNLPAVVPQTAASTLASLDLQPSHTETPSSGQTKAPPTEAVHGIRRIPIFTQTRIEGSSPGLLNKISPSNILPEWSLKTPLLPNILPQIPSVSLSWIVPVSLTSILDLTPRNFLGMDKHTTTLGSSAQNRDDLGVPGKGVSNNEDVTVESYNDGPFLPPQIPGGFPSTEDFSEEPGTRLCEGILSESNTPLDPSSTENPSSDIWDQIILLLNTVLLEAWIPCFELVSYLLFLSKAPNGSNTEIPLLNTLILDSWTPGLELLHFIISLPHILPEHIVPDSTHFTQPSIELWVPVLEAVEHLLSVLTRVPYHLLLSLSTYKSLASFVLELSSTIGNLRSSSLSPEFVAQLTEILPSFPIASWLKLYDEAFLTLFQNKATKDYPKEEANSSTPPSSPHSCSQF